MALVMARRIAKEEGLFIGYSAGSCLQGLMQLKDKLKKMMLQFVFSMITGVVM